jgi:hypothetical protein
MVEAQLNIYHHFCSQTVAWGPDQLEGHVLLSDLKMPAGDTALGPMPTTQALPSRSTYSPFKGGKARKHMNNVERALVWTDKSRSHLHHLVEM